MLIFKQLEKKRILLSPGGKLYVLGGYDGQGYLNSVECYSLKDNKWTNVCPMQYSRSCFGTVVLDGCLYALGGYGPRYHSTVEKYDPALDSWEMVPAMSTNRINFGCGTLHGYLYVIGKCDTWLWFNVRNLDVTKAMANRTLTC